MEPERDLTHPNEEELASFWTGTLSPDALERLAAHVDGCDRCATRMESLEPAFLEYRRGLELIHARTPRSPRPVPDLVKKMKEAEARRAPHRVAAWRPAWVSGIAAVVAAITLLVWPRFGGSELRADTLLQQAVSAQAPRGAIRRVRIRTRSAPALTQENGALRARFAEARYDLDDPLSARSFAEWRHGLRNKTSQVSDLRGPAGEPERKIDTKTGEGALREAALTLDAKLSPVGVWFEFADREWVEITSAAEPGANPVPERPVWAAPPSPAVAAPASKPWQPPAERELSVRLAIDALHTGAGEPIEVTADADGSVAVTAYRLAPELEARLRAGIEDMPGVTLRAVPGSSQPPADTPRDTDAMDRAIRASQDVSFEAHYLAELASHFDAASEATLSGPSRVGLWGLRGEHAAELDRDLARLRRELEAQRAGFRPGPWGGPDGAQVQSMAESATEVDRLVTLLYDAAQPETGQAAAWRQLAVQLGALQGLAGGYSRYVEQHLRELR